MIPSSSGKATMLNIIGYLNNIDRDSYLLQDKSVERLNENVLAWLRNRHIGFVFQLFSLILRINHTQYRIVDGVSSYTSSRAKDAGARDVRLRGDGRARHYSPTQLSSGQQQRMALARALIHNSDLLIAD